MDLSRGFSGSHRNHGINKKYLMIACKSATEQVPSGNKDNSIHFKAFKPQDILAAGKHLA